MITRLRCADVAPLDSPERRAQERSTSIARIALYSGAMNRLEVDRPWVRGVTATATAFLSAARSRNSLARRLILVAAEGFKLYDGRSRSGRGFVQHGLSAIRHRPAAGEV